MRLRTSARVRRTLAAALPATVVAAAVALAVPSPAAPATVARAGAAGTGMAADAVPVSASVPAIPVTGVDLAMWVLSPGAGFTGEGGRLLAQPATVAIPDGAGGSTDLDVGTGTDHDLWARTGALPWQRLSATRVACLDGPALDVTGSGPSALLTVACEGADHGLWVASAPLGSGGIPVVSNWAPYGGRLAGPPAAATIGGAPTFLAQGTDGQVWWRVPIGWVPTGWRCIGHPGAADQGASATFACEGADRALWTVQWTGAGWGPARSAGGVLQQVVGVYPAGGGALVAAQGGDGAIWEWTPWSGWASAGGRLLPPLPPLAFPILPPYKPAISGLLDRNSVPAGPFLGMTGGWVVNASWSDLEPTPGTLARPNVIDRALAQVRQLNAGGRVLRLKIRLFAGIDAPAWAKVVGGPPVAVTDPTDNVSGTIGRFWTAAYGQAYARLQAELAAAYDQAPEIADVTIARCTTVYSEPFVRDITSPATVAAMLAAGYTVAADQACQQQAVVAHTVWTQTHSSLSFNPYQVINGNGSVAQDEQFTESMMSYCRSVLGARCTLENNSVRAGGLGGTYAAMYSRMAGSGPSITFQTATPQKVGDLAATLRWAVSMGANAVELPSGYDHGGMIDAASLAQFHRLLLANPG